MPRLRVLITVFIVSFVGFALWSVPARVLVSRVPELESGQAELRLAQPAGRAWDGSARWHWGRLTGRFDWALDWRGLTPGLELSVRGSGLELAGWLGGGADRVRALDWQLEMPVALIARHVKRGHAEGRLTGRLRELDWKDQQFRALEGEFRWTGGSVSWQPDGQAQLPPLDARVFMADGTPQARVTDPDDRKLASAQVVDGRAELRVYRAWPMLLGVSGGGKPSDVVLEVSRPLGGQGSDANG